MNPFVLWGGLFATLLVVMVVTEWWVEGFKGMLISVGAVLGIIGGTVAVVAFWIWAAGGFA